MEIIQINSEAIVCTFEGEIKSKLPQQRSEIFTTAHWMKNLEFSTNLTNLGL